MTKDSYHKTKLGAKQRGANIYPSYDRIRLAKERCYPGSIEINEDKASFSLQNLLNHTLNRLCETFEFDNNMDFEEVYSDFNFLCK
jgi:hypothetical protein